MHKASQPHPDRPWAITYSDNTKTRIMGRYSSRPDAEMAIASMKRIIHYPMSIIWDGEIKDLEALATGGH
jgi:hypothetical protein